MTRHTAPQQVVWPLSGTRSHRLGRCLTLTRTRPQSSTTFAVSSRTQLTTSRHTLWCLEVWGTRQVTWLGFVVPLHAASLLTDFGQSTVGPGTREDWNHAQRSPERPASNTNNVTKLKRSPEKGVFMTATHFAIELSIEDERAQDNRATIPDASPSNGSGSCRAQWCVPRRERESILQGNV